MTTVEELAPNVAVLEARYESITDELWAIRQSLQELAVVLREQATLAAEIQTRLSDHDAKLDIIMARSNRGRSALLSDC